MEPTPKTALAMGLVAVSPGMPVSASRFDDPVYGALSPLLECKALGQGPHGTYSSVHPQCPAQGLAQVGAQEGAEMERMNK